MHTIISVKSVFTCKTPGSGWLNLAQVRQLQHSPAGDAFKQDLVVITWHNGDNQPFQGEDATAILQAWEEAQNRCHCHSKTEL
ncbi:hypothetical protein [Calothrix sp. NIES-2098]|uniref:hypothetical protein n=1 Tax=Calothrix sp. NIES-2098 TaxID=1954171 RepID=UPI000B61A0E0|nr:hypothetical protein NIES2098_17650 [Calothrix sp. NIES-2098]